jgi:hypothetical protein
MERSQRYFDELRLGATELEAKYLGWAELALNCSQDPVLREAARNLMNHIRAQSALLNIDHPMQHDIEASAAGLQRDVQSRLALQLN